MQSTAAQALALAFAPELMLPQAVAQPAHAALLVGNLIWAVRLSSQLERGSAAQE